MKTKAKADPRELTVGGRIRKYRKAQGMTQEDLEEVSGVSQNHISSLERGVSQIGLEALTKLAPALHVSKDFLLTGKDNGNTLIPQLEDFVHWASEQDEETQLKLSSILSDLRGIVE